MMETRPYDETSTGASAPVDSNSDPAPNSETSTEERLTVELASERARADESHEKWLYALAELENFRKRMDRVLTDRIILGRKTTIGKFLPVIDNLERAIGLEQDAAGLREGLAGTLRGFEALLESEDIRPIEILGKPFDPRLAEGIGTRSAPGVEDDTVVDVVRRGYMIGDEVLRPAQVIVAKHAPSE